MGLRKGAAATVPRRGDWIETTGFGSKVVLRFYCKPPSRGGGCRINVDMRIGPNEYLGPVHDVDHSVSFVNVMLFFWRRQAMPIKGGK